MKNKTDKAEKIDKIETPKITDAALLPLQPIDALQTKEEYSRCQISDIQLEYQEAEKVSFDKVLFKNVIISESSLRAIELTDVIFENCDLSNVNFSEAFIHRTEFRQCKMIGTDFTRARFQNVSVINSLCDFASFRFSKLKLTAFGQCSLNSADYYQADFQKVAFEDCKIDQAVMAGVRLKDTDLSSCEFTGLLVDLEDLPGCIISADQAASFAGLLGLVIK
ncbi:pentapeptide repeat-containing protein [Paenibacillus typhae]|uniref:pentapeptide repeat-containing protein n=1 Tax=Paenibacillus typhae TaxID=1174501 RepID=UPI001C8ECAF3|nr:pentapeptide repeat-containing protein [Paenibacillus typhae]MBY0014427.1 pentapeptide repeat-containing protein [Paenibacillus typhae]